MIKSEEKKEIIAILKAQNNLIDQILKYQNVLRKAVVKKNWNALQNCRNKIENCTTSFNEFEEKRNNIATIEEICVDAESKQLVFELKQKLLKSKIKNKAIKDYTIIVQDFIHQVMDKALRQRRNTLYSWNGKIIKPHTERVILNKVL